jgi:hypothetical protein
VVTESFYVSSVLNAIPATAGSVSSSNLAALSTIPSTAGNITVPAVTGTMMVSGNMPAFSAYASAGTSTPNSTYTKILFATEEFDTNNNFASSTFTPTVAGYYQINAAIGPPTFTSGYHFPSIYKNGSAYKYGQLAYVASSINGQVVVSSLVYCNGTTDYIEIYWFQSSGGTVTSGSGGTTTTWFNGAMIRSA